jgi:hypothetical protein
MNLTPSHLALSAATGLSLVAGGFWSVSSSASEAATPAVHLSAHHLLASYWSLASAPTGDPWTLYLAIAAIYTAAIFISLYRKNRATAPPPVPDQPEQWDPASPEPYTPEDLGEWRQ